MVNWSDPVTVQQQLFATVKVNHTVAGVYIWEVASSITHDIRLITRQRDGRSLLTKWCYLLCRYLCLAAICSILVGFNVTTEINCEGWLLSVFVLGFLAFELASILVAIRVVAIWQHSRPVMALIGAALLTQFAFIIYVSSQANAHWDPVGKGCAFEDTEAARKFYTTTLVVDTFLLVLMFVGLARVRDARTHGLWRFLWVQGFMWVVLVMIVEIPSVTLLWLNLNQPMNVIFTTPELVALVIAATRMYRSLSNYSDSYRPSGVTTRTRDVELRDPFMLPIEVTVHKERRQEESRLQFGHNTTMGTSTLDSKFAVGGDADSA
ncbi:unnamed protein product [Peniophora sp. CBMAI 1063]|nr:unnamed protein product [Peniophora sp. CBMAI 1063]